MGAVHREIKNFDVGKYGGVDLERLGKALVEQVIRHFGMMRYEKSGIKVYDITDSEMGKLSDKVLTVFRGIKRSEGIAVYRREITGLLRVVGELEGKKVRGSVVDSLRKAVAEEIKIFSREFIHFEGLWEL